MNYPWNAGFKLISRFRLNYFSLYATNIIQLLYAEQYDCEDI